MIRQTTIRDLLRKGQEAPCLLLFPGLDAILLPVQMRRWLDVPEVVPIFSRVSQALSEVSGKNEDLLALLRTMRRPRELDEDRVLVGLIAIQIAISELVKRIVDTDIDIVTGCSHGDMARLVFCECIDLDELVRFAWVSGRARMLCEPGLNASARSVQGRLSDKQLEWINSFPVSVSHWAHHHATVSGKEEVVHSMIAAALDHDIKMHKLLPVGIHSPVMAPAVEHALAYAKDITLRPPQYRIFSSVYADFIQTPDQIRQEAAVAASSPIQWMKTIKSLKDEIGVRQVICIGPSSSLIDWMKSDPDYDCITTVDAWDLYQAHLLENTMDCTK